LFGVIPKGFIPSEDTGQIIADTKAPEGVTFDQLQALQARVAHIVMQNPNIAAAMSSAGQGGRRHQRRQHRPPVHPPQTAG